MVADVVVGSLEVLVVVLFDSVVMAAVGVVSSVGAIVLVSVG